MIGNSSPQVKSVSLSIGDPEDKLSLAFAMAQGYKVTLTHEDGEAEILKPDGTTYHVHNFECSCPDSIGRKGGSYQKGNGQHFCKHVAWVAQMRPCEYCGAVMYLTEYRTAFGSRLKVFECEMCRNAASQDLVREERRAEQRIRQTLEAHNATA